MQYPVEIPGVNNIYFLKAALNAVRKHRGEEELDAMEFLQLAREKMKLVELDEAFMNRPVNEGFSGGEKKRNEIFQMAVLDPKLAILDETDSGLDIDALRIVAKGVNQLRSEEHAVLVITHYQRLLDYLVPDYVHVLPDGRIVKSGGKELALELEQKGYGWVEEEAGSRGSRCRSSGRIVLRSRSTAAGTGSVREMSQPAGAGDPEWLRQLRAAALARFIELGFPDDPAGRAGVSRTSPPIARMQFAAAGPREVQSTPRRRAWSTGGCSPPGVRQRLSSRRSFPVPTCRPGWS